MDGQQREDERRSPVGDFLFGALARRGERPLAYAELLQLAGQHGLTMSSVLAWATRAEEAGLVEQLHAPGGEGRSLRLTPSGVALARSDRRRFQRRARWVAPPDEID